MKRYLLTCLLALAAACAQAGVGFAEIAGLQGDGPVTLLSPPPPMDRLGEIAAGLLGDPPGFDRAVLPQVDRQIVEFLRKHLLP